jgi:hypothetical protein
MVAARLKAASRPWPGQWKPGLTEPYKRPLSADGSGSRFSKPAAAAEAGAFGVRIPHLMGTFDFFLFHPSFLLAFRHSLYLFLSKSASLLNASLGLQVSMSHKSHALPALTMIPSLCSSIQDFQVRFLA